MKQNYFEISSNQLKVLHLESLKSGMYLIAGAFFSMGSFFLIVTTIGNLTEGRPIFPDLRNWISNPFYIIVSIIIPIAVLILSRKCPPAPTVTFHRDTQTIKWQAQSACFEVPFTSVKLTSTRTMSKSGISSVFVTVSAFSDKPFFHGQKPSKDPSLLYNKKLIEDISRGEEKVMEYMSKITGEDLNEIRVLSKNGNTEIAVTVEEPDGKVKIISGEQFFNPTDCYIRDLCYYKAGTQEEADESMEIIRMFMSGKWEEYAAEPKFEL